MEFHKAQLEAIRHFNGPCITLAGPGSGKTTVLTYRILNLIEKCGVAPEHILVITFTRAAATEMKERFLKLSDNRYSGVCFQTFHSFFFMILRKAYGYRADNIITQQEQTRFFKNILNEYELEITDTMELIRHATAWISNVKRSGKSPDTQPVAAAGICPQEILCEIYHKYQQYLTAKRLIDFEDMTVYCYDLFSQRKDILWQWQEQYQYILVDEFQDIDAQQFQTLQLLADRYRNLFIVGDDDQSIYGFRGACPDYMQEFKKIYPEAVQINLCVNYRCRAPIVAAAKSVIAHNKNRYEKDIVAAQTGYGMQTACVVVKEFESKIMSLEDAYDEMWQRNVRFENKRKSLLEYLQACMTIAGVKKVEGVEFDIVIRKNPHAVKIIEEGLVPVSYWKIPEPAPARLDRKSILKDLKDGKSVPGCQLEQTERVEIR